MAKNPKNALDLLYGLWEYSIKNAKAEAAELQKIMDREGKGEKLEAWDWWYYAEKLRQEKYDLNEDAIKPYFSQEDVHNGLCTVHCWACSIATTCLVPANGAVPG